MLRKITFRNGLRLILVPQPSSLAATVLILVEAGSEYETKRINGVSHFLEHMMFKGTVKRPQPGTISTELDRLGAEYNAFTGQEYTGYWAKAEKGKLNKIIDIVADLYLNPIFNPAEIDKERGVVIEEINLYEDTPSRRVQELFTTLLYGDQPAGWDVAGRKIVIRSLKREDFIAYRAAHYVPSATAIVVAGAFNPSDVVRRVRSLFADLPTGPKGRKSRVTERQQNPKILASFKSSDQSHLVIGARAFDIFDKRRYALQVMANILGGGMSSRLFRRVREELGAAYYIKADADLMLDHGYFGVSSGVDHLKIEQVLRIIIEEFRRLRTERVSADELKKAQDHLTGGLILGLETSDQLASFYGGQEILTKKVESPRDFVKKIRAVQSNEIIKVARDIFTNKRLNLAVIGPYKKTTAFRKIVRL